MNVNDAHRGKMNGCTGETAGIAWIPDGAFITGNVRIIKIQQIKKKKRTTEKKGQHRFPNYNTICCHGNQWSDLAKFGTHPSFYACPHCLQV